MVHVRGDLFFGVKKLYQKGPIFACPIPPARFGKDILHREVGSMGLFWVTLCISKTCADIQTKMKSQIGQGISENGF